jgi:putative nucleotide binding protein
MDVRQKDDWVVVLDFLARGRPGDRKAEPLAQVVGERFFNLLELVIKEGREVKPGDRIYIGPERREHVKYIRGRIGWAELTSFAKSELESVVSQLVRKNEARFVDFFNRAGPASARLHSLELLPGIGKKHLWSIIGARRREPFKSFKDLQQRVPLLPDPVKMVVKRVLRELQQVERHSLFVART